MQFHVKKFGKKNLKLDPYLPLIKIEFRGHSVQSMVLKRKWNKKRISKNNGNNCFLTCFVHLKKRITLFVIHFLIV